MQKQTIRKGHRVETSGEGRTARWPHGTGTVMMVRKNRVYVRWDGTHFEDEMDAREVRRSLVPMYWSEALGTYVTIPEG